LGDLVGLERLSSSQAKVHDLVVGESYLP